jgi:uncharacterized protein (TIGR02246 family)
MNETSQAEILARLDALEARLREHEDREAIRELFNRYNFAADTGDAQAFAETWSDDGVLSTGRSLAQGRDKFLESINDPDGVHKVEIEGKGSLHTIGVLTIRIDGDEAWAEGPSVVWIREGKTFRAFVAAYNHWDLRKTGGRWEVARREARTVAPGKAKEVWTAWRATA